MLGWVIMEKAPRIGASCIANGSVLGFIVAHLLGHTQAGTARWSARTCWATRRLELGRLRYGSGVHHRDRQIRLSIVVLPVKSFCDNENILRMDCATK